MLKLYRFPGATCAAKVLLALAEKRVAFEDAVITREALAEPWYRALNPSGVVPTIEHNGTVIVESSVILNYIEDAFDGPRLRPVNALARARMNHWLKLADEALPSIGIMTYVLFARQAFLAKTTAELESYFAAIPDDDKRSRMRASIEQGLNAPHVPAALAALDTLQRRIDAAASVAGFLADDDYSLADAALTPLVRRMADLSLLAPSNELPRLHRWWDGVRSRSSFAAAILAPEPGPTMAALRAAAGEQADGIALIRPKMAYAA